MVVIRLTRGGAKREPFYHVVATDKRNRRDGGFLARLGYFNPQAMGQEKRLVLNRDEINEFLAKGAQMSERVAALVKEFDKNGGPVDARPVKVHTPKPKKVEAPAEEAPAEEAAAEAEETSTETTAEEKPAE